MSDFNFSGIVKSLTGFFGVTRQALSLIAAVMLLALIAAYLDGQGGLTAIPRFILSILYAFGTLCFLYLICLLVAAGFNAGTAAYSEHSASRTSAQKARINFRAMPERHMLVFIYLKQKGTKRFLDDHTNTLTAMVASKILEEEEVTFDKSYFEVPSFIWNSPELADRVSRSPELEDPPWWPQSHRI